MSFESPPFLTSRRRNECVLVQLVERTVELLFLNGLCEIAMRMNLKSVVDDVVVLRDEYNSLRCHIFFSDTLCKLEPVYIRHSVIEKKNIEFTDSLRQLLGV